MFQDYFYALSSVASSIIADKLTLLLKSIIATVVDTEINKAKEAYRKASLTKRDC